MLPMMMMGDDDSSVFCAGATGIRKVDPPIIPKQRPFFFRQARRHASAHGSQVPGQWEGAEVAGGPGKMGDLGRGRGGGLTWSIGGSLTMQELDFVSWVIELGACLCLTLTGGGKL